MRCFVVAGFLLTSASRGPSAIAELLVPISQGTLPWNQFCVVSKTQPRAIFFAIFTPYESVLGLDDRSEFFLNISRDVAMAINSVAKWGKITYLLCTYHSVIPKRNGISPPQCAR